MVVEVVDLGVWSLNGGSWVGGGFVWVGWGVIFVVGMVVLVELDGGVWGGYYWGGDYGSLVGDGDFVERFGGRGGGIGMWVVGCWGWWYG